MHFLTPQKKEFYQNLLRIGLPVALQNLLTTSMSMVDTLMIGTSAQGELAVGAVGVCATISGLFFNSYWGFASGGTLFFSQYWGAKDEKGICRAFGVTYVCMLLVGILFTVLSLAFPEWIIALYTDKPATAEIAVKYLRIVGLCFVPQVLSMALSVMLRSIENVRTPLVASIVSMLTNTLLNYLLIFGKFGCPAMGAEGAAVASVTASLVNLFVLVFSCVRRRNPIFMKVRAHFSWTKAFLGEYFRKSAPIIFNELFYGVGQAVVNIVLGHQDEYGIAAVAIFRVIEGFIFSFFIGLSNASSVMVGKSVGSGELETAYRDAKHFLWLCPVITLCVCLLILPLRGLILSPFALSAGAYDYICWMLVIYTIAGPLRTCNYIGVTIFRAGGEALIGAVLEIGALFTITVPLVWVTGMVLHLPFLLVFASMYGEEVLRLIICTWYMCSARWLRPVTEQGRAALGEFRRAHHLKALKS